jgi:hypothetical protein
MMARLKVWRVRDAVTGEALGRWHFTERLCEPDIKSAQRKGVTPIPVPEVIDGWQV